MGRWKHRSEFCVKLLPGIKVALVIKKLPASAGDVRDVGSVPGSGRSPAGGHCDALQYSWLENPIDRGARRATVCRITQSWTWPKWLSKHAQIRIKLSSLHMIGCYVCLMSPDIFLSSYHLQIQEIWGRRMGENRGFRAEGAWDERIMAENTSWHIRSCHLWEKRVEGELRGG